MSTRMREILMLEILYVGSLGDRGVVALNCGHQRSTVGLGAARWLEA